eukprot:1042507_1
MMPIADKTHGKSKWQCSIHRFILALTYSARITLFVGEDELYYIQQRMERHKEEKHGPQTTANTDRERNASKIEEPPREEPPKQRISSKQCLNCKKRSIEIKRENILEQSGF